MGAPWRGECLELGLEGDESQGSRQEGEAFQDEMTATKFTQASPASGPLHLLSPLRGCPSQACSAPWIGLS